MSKKPKIEILSKPRVLGASVSVRVRFNYDSESFEYGFSIPVSKIQGSSLEHILKQLYEEKKPVAINVDVPDTIDW